MSIGGMVQRLGQLLADAMLLRALGLVERIDKAEGREPLPRPDVDDGQSIMHYAEQVHNRSMHEAGCGACGACGACEEVGESVEPADGYWN